jgi:hypothetical protein
MVLVRLPILLLWLHSVAIASMPSLAGPPAVQAAAPTDRLAFLGPAERIADGVDLFSLDGAIDGIESPESRAAANGAPPRSIRFMRIDPRRVRLVSALATGEVPARATVLDIARRTGALAAVNAGFFSPTGDPNGVLKIDGRLVSDTSRARGAVSLRVAPGGIDALFDQVSVKLRLRWQTDGRWRSALIDGVDTTRGRGRLVLYTPASGGTTDTKGGLEWTLRPRGSSLRASRATATGPTTGNAAIPADGYVLSFGGTSVPATLTGLSRATTIQLRESIVVRSRTREREWSTASTIVGGAGLLVRNGTPLTDWTIEQLSPGFETTPHPRTVIARDRAGHWWLITIDGRQPGRAIGMSFTEMQALLARLDVVDALNLDGGGSTTMVAGQKIVNRPSDLTGPRPVSDAIIVMSR